MEALGSPDENQMLGVGVNIKCEELHKDVDGNIIAISASVDASPTRAKAVIQLISIHHGIYMAPC